MHLHTHPKQRGGRKPTDSAWSWARALAFSAWAAAPFSAPLAQPLTTPASPTLRQAFDAAWALQPEAQALGARRQAAQAQQQAAQAWTPEPVALALATKTDRLNRGAGAREYEAGVAIPLWLPGERTQAQALASAESRAVESQATAAQLRVAAAVRGAWWQWRRSQADATAAQAHWAAAQGLAADVAQRVKAGDLAPADLHQAAGAVAAAAAGVAAADAAALVAQGQLRTLTQWHGPAWAAAQGPSAAQAEAEPEPTPEAAAAAAAENAAHGEWQALQDRLAVAQGAAALAAARSRGTPELTLATTRDRGAFGEAWQQTTTLGLRVPLGGGPRHSARSAAAQADSLEAQAQLNLARARLAGEREAAQALAAAAALQWQLAERRAQLARETRGFFDQSFRLGQTDLPTRLRVETEAADAERQATRARLDRAAAISAWRQALGWLPP